MSDKRKAFWVAKPQIRKDMRDCFKSDAALYAALRTNTKTGKNIVDGVDIKRDHLKDALGSFFRFLNQIKTGEAHIDSSKHHEDDVKRMVKKYVDGKDGVTNWETHAINNDPEAAKEAK